MLCNCFLFCLSLLYNQHQDFGVNDMNAHNIIIANTLLTSVSLHLTMQPGTMCRIQGEEMYLQDSSKHSTPCFCHPDAA